MYVTEFDADGNEQEEARTAVQTLYDVAQRSAASLP